MPEQLTFLSEARLVSPSQQQASEQERLNELLMGVEQIMTREEGLPRRFWFRHQIYAPGFYTGYGVKTLPGIREALEQRSWDEVSEQIKIVSATIHRVADAIDQASGLLSLG